MDWSNTLSISHLFYTHDIVVLGPANEQIIVHIPSLREQLDESFYVRFLQLFNEESMVLWTKLLPDSDKGQILQALMTDPRLTNLQEFSVLSKLLHEKMPTLLPRFEIRERQLYSEKTLLTGDAIDEVLFVLSTGIGKKVERPQHFGPDEEAARKFYERAKAAQAKSAKLRAEHSSTNNDGLMDMFVMISINFPYTFEQMYDMTLAQLHYLQRMSSQIMSYNYNMMAYTAGNLKKAPNFFLK